MKHLSTLRFLGLVLGASAVLSACGGGGGGGLDGAGAGAPSAPLPGSPPLFADSDVPLAATQSAQAAMAFVGTVVADPVADKDGLRIDAADLATTDSEEADPDA